MELWVQAILRSMTQVVDLLKKKSQEELTQRDRYGKTAFHFACMIGNTEEAKMIIQKSEEFEIQLNAKDANGRTAFHSACLYNKTDIIELIIENAESFKIDISAKDNNGKTGYQIADNDSKKLIKRKLSSLGLKKETAFKRILKFLKRSE